MTDNTQELDEILTGFAYGEYSPHWTDERRTYTKLEAKQALLDQHKKRELEARIDPFEFVEPCEPDCDDVRHAYHQGQWDMATRIKAQQEAL